MASNRPQNHPLWGHFERAMDEGMFKAWAVDRPNDPLVLWEAFLAGAQASREYTAKAESTLITNKATSKED